MFSEYYQDLLPSINFRRIQLLEGSIIDTILNRFSVYPSNLFEVNFL